MTCNDCIHFDACRNLLEAFSPKYKGKSLTFTKACKHFKNKADFVEVVMCKDCKHWGGVTFGYICRRFSGSYIRNETRKNDFCSYGERNDT